ncbi:MAG: hypothetical protein K2G61_05010 [Bacteroidaceae bacterium]|nr:hypothetical protein [Bacteroidaceae bacterium]
MKKEYIKPAMALIDMNVEAVIALSVQNGVEVDGNSGWEMLSRDEEDMDWDEEQGW